MRVLDKGHKYGCRHLDGDGEEILTFVKREGQGYPGNSGHYPGTNLQEVMRALIDRVAYLDWQEPHAANLNVISHLRSCIRELEERAAERHGRKLRFHLDVSIEHESVCGACGHIGCDTECRKFGGEHE